MLYSSERVLRVVAVSLVACVGNCAFLYAKALPRCSEALALALHRLRCAENTFAAAAVVILLVLPRFAERLIHGLLLHVAVDAIEAPGRLLASPGLSS